MQPSMEPRFKNFNDFWPHYLAEHSRPLTRCFHFLGTALLFPVLILAMTTSVYYLALAPVVGYGFAWVSHLTIERNKPTTFTYPLWSLLADFKMFGLIIAGKMHKEINRASCLNDLLLDASQPHH